MLPVNDGPANTTALARPGNKILEDSNRTNEEERELKNTGGNPCTATARVNVGWCIVIPDRSRLGSSYSPLRRHIEDLVDDSMEVNAF